MQILGYLLARFSEPSSYAGLGAVLALVGFHFSDTLVGQLAQFLAAGCALAALFLKERGVIHCLALAFGLASALGLAACQQIAAEATKIDPKLTAACDAALALSSLPGLTRCGSRRPAAAPRRSPSWRRTRPASPGSNS